MEQGHSDGKRPRLSSWSASVPAGPALPHPHSSPAPRPPHSTHPHHQPSPGLYQQPYTPRTSEHSSGPPAPVSLHGHAQPHHSDIDRRHHEAETLAPMQDHFRQPTQPHSHHQVQSPSPAIPPYHQYPPRDSIVKRESAVDEPRRSNSSGHATGSLPHTPHPASAPHHSASYPENQPRQMNYDNGHSLPPTPGAYRPPTSFPPPTPSHQSPYEPQGSYPPTSEYYSVYSSSSSSKKKNTRASQACDQCRQLKAKCDETKPCKTCRDKGTECRYRDPVPKATDKAQADILEYLSDVRSFMNDLREHFKDIDARVLNLEVNRTNGIQVKTDPGSEGADEAEKSILAERQNASDAYYSNAARQERTVSNTERANRIEADEESQIEYDPGPPVQPGEPAIPINHTTLAGLLLEWPSIRDFTKPHLEREGVRHVTEYPISQEQNRGVLIVYGRGEDCHSSRQPREIHREVQRETPDHGQLDMADNSSDTASPSPAADWGHTGGGLGLSPGDQVEYKGGVLGVDGNPDFSEDKVWNYVASFKDNILNMHPIIQHHVLDDWVHHFLDTLPKSSVSKSYRPQPTKPSFAVGTGSQSQASEQTGSKRKRSPGPDSLDSSSAQSSSRSGRPPRTIHSALILTVLALGKICLTKDKVPDALHYGEPQPHGSPYARLNGLPPSPSQGSPPSQSSHSQASGLASPKEPERMSQSRRSSIHGPTSAVRAGYGLKKNYEVIPGLEYFAYATDILGNHHGAYKNMKTVYANIFAGLYHGQLARPMESFAWIHSASHKLHAIMRPSLDKLRRFKVNHELIQETKYNQMALTFWTCLQLESDLIAELQILPSGLLTFEDDMPHPNLSLLEGFNQRILDSYPGQLYLRTHLNSIHRMFYAPDKPGMDENQTDQKYNNVGLVVDAVSGMTWVAQSFAFDENDPPAGDILAARLRAKYWGAQSITYRPFIRQILMWSERMKNPRSSPNMCAVSEFREGIQAPTIDPSAKSRQDISPAVLDYAKRGIKALIESTRAFHGLGDGRPIITNVFGTAHAQWGNLLVLTAAYKDPVLTEWVPGDLLETLYQKTINFLDQSSTATSSLRIDMRILQGLQRDLFSRPDTKAASSFSSSSSIQTPKLAMAAPPSTAGSG